MADTEKIVLGIDPGTAKMGFGVVKYDNPSLDCLQYGVLETEAGIADHLRLKELYQGLEALIKKYKPDYIAVEDLFYFKNQKTLVHVAAARGVALLAAANNGKECYSFTPLQVKQAVTSYGKADKRQVQEMTKAILRLEAIPRPDDAADALAIAICCAHSANLLLGAQKLV